MYSYTIAWCMACPTQSWKDKLFPIRNGIGNTNGKFFPHWRSFQSFTSPSGTTNNQSLWLSTADSCLYTANVFTPQTLFTCKSKLSRVGGTNVGCATIEVSKHTGGLVGEFCGRGLLAEITHIMSVQITLCSLCWGKSMLGSPQKSLLSYVGIFWKLHNFPLHYNHFQI